MIETAKQRRIAIVPFARTKRLPASLAILFGKQSVFGGQLCRTPVVQLFGGNGPKGTSRQNHRSTARADRTAESALMNDISHHCSTLGDRVKVWRQRLNTARCPNTMSAHVVRHQDQNVGPFGRHFRRGGFCCGRFCSVCFCCVRFCLCRQNRAQQKRTCHDQENGRDDFGTTVEHGVIRFHQ